MPGATKVRAAVDKMHFVHKPGFHVFYDDREGQPGKPRGKCPVCGLEVLEGRDEVNLSHYDKELAYYPVPDEYYHGHCYAGVKEGKPVKEWQVVPESRKYDPARKYEIVQPGETVQPAGPTKVCEGCDHTDGVECDCSWQCDARQPDGKTAMDGNGRQVIDFRGKILKALEAESSLSWGQLVRRVGCLEDQEDSLQQALSSLIASGKVLEEGKSEGLHSHVRFKSKFPRDQPGYVEQPMDAADAAEMLQQSTDETTVLHGLESVSKEDVKKLSKPPVNQVKPSCYYESDKNMNGCAWLTRELDSKCGNPERCTGKKPEGTYHVSDGVLQEVEKLPEQEKKKPAKPKKEKPVCHNGFVSQDQVLKILDSEGELSKAQLQRRLECQDDILQHVLDELVRATDILVEKPEGRGFVARYRINRTPLSVRVLELVGKGVDNYRDLGKALSRDKFSLKPAVKQLVQDGSLRWKEGAFGRLMIPVKESTKSVTPAYAVDCEGHDLEPDGCDACGKCGEESVAEKSKAKKYRAKKQEPVLVSCINKYGGPECAHNVLGGTFCVMRNLKPPPFTLEKKGSCLDFLPFSCGHCVNINRKMESCSALGRRPIVGDVLTCGNYHSDYARQLTGEEQGLCKAASKKEPEPAPEKPAKPQKSKGQKKPVKQPCEICGKSVLWDSKDSRKVGGGFGGPGFKPGDHYVHDLCSQALPGLARKIARGEAQQPTHEEIVKAIMDKARKDQEEREARKHKARGKVVGMCCCGEGFELKMNELGEVWCDDCGPVYIPDPRKGPYHSDGKGWILCTPLVSLSCWHYHPDNNKAPCDAKGTIYPHDTFWGYYCGHYKPRLPATSKDGTATGAFTSGCTSEQKTMPVPEKKDILVKVYFEKIDPQHYYQTVACYSDRKKLTEGITEPPRVGQVIEFRDYHDGPRNDIKARVLDVIQKGPTSEIKVLVEKIVETKPLDDRYTKCTVCRRKIRKDNAKGLYGMCPTCWNKAGSPMSDECARALESVGAKPGRKPTPSEITYEKTQEGITVTVPEKELKRLENGGKSTMAVEKPARMKEKRSRTDAPISRMKPHKAVKSGTYCQNVVKLPKGQKTFAEYPTEA